MTSLLRDKIHILNPQDPLCDDSGIDHAGFLQFYFCLRAWYFSCIGYNCVFLDWMEGHGGLEVQLQPLVGFEKKMGGLWKCTFNHYLVN